MPCTIDHDSRKNINYDKVGPNLNSSTSFATLDTAFSQSPAMQDFQCKMLSHNPMLSQNLVDEQNVSVQDNSQDGIIISQESEEKMNNNAEEMIGALYNRDQEHARQIKNNSNAKQYLYPHIPVVQNGVQFPLDRTHRYTAQQHGSELIEKFDIGDDAQYVWDTTNQTTYELTGMSFFKFILLLILIAILIYGIYWLYTNNTTTDITTATTGTGTTVRTSTYNTGTGTASIRTSSYLF
jgi:hypothetical protein